MDRSSQTETWGNTDRDGGKWTDLHKQKHKQGNTDRDGGKWTALHKQKHGETLTGIAVNGQIFTNRNMGKH